jgi:hypothetical protein
MAHDHHHGPEELHNYLIQQIFTLAICGALGAVAVSLYAQGTLKLILHPTFHSWVMMGGVALLVMVLIRGIAVWQFAGELQKSRAHAHEHEHEHDHEHVHAHAHVLAKEPSQAVTAPTGSGVGLSLIPSPALAATSHVHGPGCCDHDHDHDHGHNHDHANEHDHNHEADHDHDHSWAPWRYVLLLLPVALFFLNLPNDVFGDSYQKPFDTKGFDLDQINAEGNGEKLNVGFLELEKASLTHEGRTFYSGKTVRLSGRYAGIAENRFTLVRYKINCCAADAIQLNAVILVDPKGVPEQPRLARLDEAAYKNKWVQVTGRVQFLNRKGTNEYMTALVVKPTPDQTLAELVQITQSDPNPYETGQ